MVRAKAHKKTINEQIQESNPFRKNGDVVNHQRRTSSTAHKEEGYSKAFSKQKLLEPLRRKLQGNKS